MRRMVFGAWVAALLLAVVPAFGQTVAVGIAPYVLGVPLSQFTPRQLGTPFVSSNPKPGQQMFEATLPMAWGSVTAPTRRVLDFRAERLAYVLFSVDGLAARLQATDILLIARAMTEYGLRFAPPPSGGLPMVFGTLSAADINRGANKDLLLSQSGDVTAFVHVLGGTSLYFSYSLKSATQ